jgi:hypothetical protein
MTIPKNPTTINNQVYCIIKETNKEIASDRLSLSFSSVPADSFTGSIEKDFLNTVVPSAGKAS